jgi:hypothetical protein
MISKLQIVTDIFILRYRGVNTPHDFSILFHGNLNHLTIVSNYQNASHNVTLPARSRSSTLS